MEDSSSRNCKRSDGGFEDAADSSTAAASFSKKMKKTDDDGDDKLEFAELKLSSPSPAKKEDGIRRFCSSADRKAATSSNSSSAAGRLLFDGEFRSGAADSRASGGCCFSNVESSELDVKGSEFGLLDLEAKSYETESSSTCIDNKFSREATPSSRFSEEANSEDKDDMADSSVKAETSTAMEKATKTKEITTASQSVPPPATPAPAAAKESPSHEEIDEFFTAAENEQQNRFAEKYNFDVVKDVPLEGRYQWVRLKP